MSHYLRVSVRPSAVSHGFDAQGVERLEAQASGPFVEKLLRLDRLLSATEETLLVTGAHGRLYYWEYEGGLDALEARLAALGAAAPPAGDT